MGVVNPNLHHREFTTRGLTDAATFIRRLRHTTLSRCQFPATLNDANGTITKPVGW